MRLLADRTDFDWDKEIEAAEKKTVHRDEAQKLYAEGKLKDGEVFCVAGAKKMIVGEQKERDAWCMAAFVAGKLIFVLYNANDVRLPRLKRQGIAKLLDIIKTGMVDTRQTTMVPPRYQSLKNPDHVLYGKSSRDDDPESGNMSEDIQIVDENNIAKEVNSELTGTDVEPPVIPPEPEDLQL